MTVTTPGTGGDSPRATGRDTADDATSLMGTFGGRAATDQCVECGAPLALDQRYCVECGTRRGKPRFNLQSPSPADPVAAAPEPSRRRRSTWSPSATLVAGIATLLLALGVGVIIGESGSNTPKGGEGIHVTVNGGGSSGAASTTPATSSAGGSTGSTSTSTSKGKSKTKSKAKSKTKAKVNKAAEAKNAPAASSGVSKTITKTPTVKPGGSCTTGTAGCQGGKETGNFFGGG